MNLFARKESNEIVRAYLDRMQKTKDKLEKEQIRLLDFLMVCFTRYDYKVDDWFRKWMATGEILDISQLFEKDRYPVLVHLLGETYAAKYVAWLQKMARIPYTSGYYRRPVRSGNPALHYGLAMRILKDFLAVVASGLPLEVILEGGRNETEQKFIGDIHFYPLLSIEIDAGNQAVIDKVKDILCGDSSNGRLSYDLLQGIVAASNRELYELEGKLLLAARLQEGLRQAIAETMDSGLPEAFLYLFEVIRTHDLQRFSAIKRAVGTWTGLVNEAENDRINQKVMDLIYRLLTDPAHVEACVQSQDSMEVYLGLWAKGFYGMEEMFVKAAELIAEGVKHKIQVLFHYLAATQCDWIRERLAKAALERYADDLGLVAAFLPSYLQSVSFGYRSGKEDKSYFESLEEAHRHYELLKGISLRLVKKQTFSPFVFPWQSRELSRREVIEKMAAIVYIIGSNRLLDDLCNYYDLLESNVRYRLLHELLAIPSSKIQLDTVVKALGDRAESPRKEAYKILNALPDASVPYDRIAEVLKYKTGDLRQQAIRLLLKQSPCGLSGTLERLLAAPVAEKRLGALDMLLTIRTQPAYAASYRNALPWVKAIENPTGKEKILIDQLVEDASSQASYTKENAFGLYKKESKAENPPVWVPLPAPDPDFDRQKVFSLLQDGSFLKKLWGKRQERLYEIMQKLSDLIARNARYEYKSRFGDTVLLGDYFWETGDADESAPSLDHYPLASEWRKFYTEEIGDSGTLLQLMFALSGPWGDRNEYGDVEQGKGKFSEFLKNFYGFDLPGFFEWMRKLPYTYTISRIVDLLANTYLEGEQVKKTARNVLTAFCSSVNKENIRYVFSLNKGGGKKERYAAYLFHDGRIRYWMSDFLAAKKGEGFDAYFAVRYYLYQLADYFECPETCVSSDNYLSVLDFAYAYEKGLIPEAEVIRELTTRPRAEESLEEATRFLNGNLKPWQQKVFEDYEGLNFPHFKKVMDKVVRRILEIELKRGDTPTEVSSLAMRIDRIEGAAYLVGILQAFGKDTFVRSEYYYGSTYTKKEVLSKLLRGCYPAAGDTVDALAALLKEAGFTEKRLVEAAMYAPQWLEMIEASIGWKGLTSAAYYFHAHINESCDDKKKAILARYTPIDPEDLQSGAFDIDWFTEAYKEIGAERFQSIYEAAKYISSGAGHTRARKYADAVNGKWTASEIKVQIGEKRNKDLLMSYCLIPLDQKDGKDLLERYQYLRQFLKESKAFGAQRQESEKKAVEIGLQNLARNAGYADVTRLTWAMETELIEEMEPYFKPHELEGIEAFVRIDEEGKSELTCMKAGKPLNSLPAKLKKHPYIAELKAVHKKLKDQYSRSRMMLEQAMEDATPFYIRELSVLTRNPVIWPLLKSLVFVKHPEAGAGADAGFFTEGGLVTADGEFLLQSADTKVRIAHPVDLYRRGVWASYQKYLFDGAIRQPFKQVFRELYLKTADELPMPHSLRYAGNQIQPRKTVAVLKGRRWIADYEDGLQKVYYKENIVANIYALADWFSPADMEAPTLEWVSFSDRKSFRALKIADIPEIIFSEVMRDVDLAVSVAHAGGVDPEASHSTVEMRRALVAFTLPLFKLTNVTLKGSHAFIKGSLADYHIHLGSGVIHQEGGAAIVVLPVHSQHRGRLFLPFVDEDPKTAEILSKVLLFAEDTKIKDPFVLQQIRKQ